LCFSFRYSSGGLEPFRYLLFSEPAGNGGRRPKPVHCLELNQGIVPGASSASCIDDGVGPEQVQLGPSWPTEDAVGRADDDATRCLPTGKEKKLIVREVAPFADCEPELLVPLAIKLSF